MPTHRDDFSGETRWSRALRTPLRAFLDAESRGSVLLLAATAVALAWVNIDGASYTTVWHTTFAVRLGRWALAMDLREWINSGLMAFFFFVVGLEARREADIGELRELRRIALPLLAGLGGMALPVVLFLAINHGATSAAGWGAAMSTDTAFALGVLTLVGPRFGNRLRVFLLTVVVVDDIVALLVIAFAYTEQVTMGPLIVAGVLFATVLGVRAARVTSGLVYAVLGVATWVAMLRSGVDPLVVGLAIGL